MLLAGLGLVGVAAASAASAGSLNPPAGPVLPTGKTTDEIEPRVDVQSLAGDATAQHLISQPGSYYLTGNIGGVAGQAAIAIDADNVTLDLGGFALLGVAGATRGVEIRNTRSQYVVRNGSIRTFDNGGVQTVNGSSGNVRIERLTVNGIANGPGIDIAAFCVRVCDCEVTAISGVGGSRGQGINLPVNGTFSSQVESCVVRGCSVRGISAGMVVSCTVEATGNTGIFGNEISNCYVILLNGTGTVFGIQGSHVSNCFVANLASSGVGATGISAADVSNCGAFNVTSTGNSVGIKATSTTGCSVQSVGGSSGSAIGLQARSASTCSVLGIGTDGSTTAPIGISTLTAIGCDVDFIGDPASVVGATGIQAETVSNCRVGEIFGGTSGIVSGISASVVSGCNVTSLSQGASTGSVTGISADVITGCRVDGINGSSSATVSGLGNATTVRDCMVSNVSNPGAGAAFGFNKPSTNAGSIENSTFRSCGDTALSIVSRQRIDGCNIQATTTGILATGVGNVIDGNNVDTCTTGISATSGANGAKALIVRNQVRNCTTNITADSPCQVGPIVTANGTIVSTSPWANFTD